jgi:hypothetical protein
VHESKTGIWLFFDRDNRYEWALRLVKGAKYDAKRHLSSPKLDATAYPRDCCLALGQLSALFADDTADLTVNTNSHEFFTELSTYERCRPAGPSVLHIGRLSWHQLSCSGRLVVASHDG